jgi:hypothetical protein
MYNNLHGQNPSADVLKNMLGLDVASKYGYYPTGRFRDIWLSDEGKKIVLFTRNGGGNREEYAQIFKAIREHRLYIRDWDDDYDSTYAYIEFQTPEEMVETLAQLWEEQGGEPKSLKEKTDAVTEEMKSMTPEQMREDPRFKPMIEVMDKIVKGEGGPIYEV